MKLALLVTTLLLTAIMCPISARPGRGSSLVSHAEYSAHDIPATLTTGITTRVSVASNGTEANGASRSASLSAHGRFVAFSSYADNLVSGDNNGFSDVFVHDRTSDETTRVSVASDGTEGNGESYGASISTDGRFVAFTSKASNLVSNDSNSNCPPSESNCSHIFVRDRYTVKTARVSVASDGTEGNDGSYGASISADGRFVAFSSLSDNLVSGDNNGFSDVFVHDRTSGETIRVSVASGGTEGNGESYGASISADGRFVAFSSSADNLVSGDENYGRDIFIHDRDNGETIRASVASDGTEGNDDSIGPSIAASGRFVAFSSWADNLVRDDNNTCYLGGLPCSDIFVHDRDSGETSRVSLASNGTEADAESFEASISEDGRFVAFESDATNLVSNDNQDYAWCRHGTHDDTNCDDVFVHDRHTGDTIRVSISSDGEEVDHDSYDPSISADGRVVAFATWASNLVNDDSNGTVDVFVHDRDVTRTFLPLIRR